MKRWGVITRTYTALLGPGAAKPLFAGAGKNKKFSDTHGLCQFFAVAETNSNVVLATTDGESVCLIKRAEIRGGSLKGESVVQALRELCAKPDTPKRPLTNLTNPSA